MRVAPVFEGTARINDDAALAARLHWCRRRTGDARRSRWRPTCIGAVAATGGARRPHLSRQRAAAQPPAHPPTTLVSGTRHLSHTATL